MDFIGKISGSMLEAEGERPWEFTDLQTFLEEEGLYDRETPDLVYPFSTEKVEPVAYPLIVMGDLQFDLAKGAYHNRHNQPLADKLTAWKDSIQRVEMAYEILAYPRLETLAGTMPVKDAIRDALEHPNQDIEEHPHRAPIELSDEELKILGKLTQVRGLPFDPNKRVYQYAELAPLRKAEHLLTDMEWQARGGQINPGGKMREEIDEQIRKRRERWRGRDSDEPPPPLKPQK
jgi:hypothetical protein